jgi:DNA gyrase/topoisomerase IV subunit B
MPIQFEPGTFIHVCGRMTFVLSARILDPQFQGQVKEKLN